MYPSWPEHIPQSGFNWGKPGASLGRLAETGQVWQTTGIRPPTNAKARVTKRTLARPARRLGKQSGAPVGTKTCARHGGDFALRAKYAVDRDQRRSAQARATPASAMTNGLKSNAIAWPHRRPKRAGPRWLRTSRSAQTVAKRLLRARRGSPSTDRSGSLRATWKTWPTAIRCKSVKTETKHRSPVPANAASPARLLHCWAGFTSHA